VQYLVVIKMVSHLWKPILYAAFKLNQGKLKQSSLDVYSDGAFIAEVEISIRICGMRYLNDTIVVIKVIICRVLAIYNHACRPLKS
jgi:hypothetical protein